jgi:hypothetical protein
MGFFQVMFRVSKVSHWLVNNGVLERQLTVEGLREAVQNPLFNRSANTFPET